MPIFPQPLPAPIPWPRPAPIPWPRPSPGVGTPLPSPGVGVGVSPSPGIGITPAPTTGGPSTGGLARLFQFNMDWRFLGALVLILLTIGLVDEMWPQWVWPYVGLLLGSLTAANRVAFSQGFSRLIEGK